jgi:FkbH-like protein
MNGPVTVPEATPAAYREAARAIKADPPPGLTPLRLAVLATFTAASLEPYVVVEGARRGLAVEPWFGPYDQLEPQALDPASALHAFRPDVILIAARLEELWPDLVWRFASLDAGALDAGLQALVERYESLVAGLKRHGAATVLLANFVEPAHAPLGLAGALHEPSPATVVERVNGALAALCRRTAGAYVLDLARAALETGLDRWNDAKLGYVARLPWSLHAQIEVGTRVARHLRALRVPACKCLVVDLDGTLWGGVLGEDGPAGIVLGADYPGRAYQDFQRALAGLRARGILLAVASKNDGDIVREVFAAHPDMVLRWDDFAAAEIHWRDKAESLRAIARALDIGVDALAFYDDSPVEREWVRGQLPEVTVLEVPASPVDRLRALAAAEAFDQLRVSAEDRRRADAYREEGERERLRARAVSPEDFWRSLDTTVQVGAVDVEHLPRVAQLMAKTNQFNTTTRRHTGAQLEAMLAAGAVGLWLRARDRYGDYGLVGVALARPEADAAWRIDTFLLSCRALGRHVEGAMLVALAREVAARGGRTLIGEFVRTARNQPAERFFADHRFTPLDGEGRLWRLDLDAAALAPPSFVTLETRAPAPAGGR